MALCQRARGIPEPFEMQTGCKRIWLGAKDWRNRPGPSHSGVQIPTLVDLEATCMGGVNHGRQLQGPFGVQTTRVGWS